MKPPAFPPDHEVFENRGWSFQDEYCDVDRLAEIAATGEFFGSCNAYLTMLTGVERAGADKHSDGCPVSVWPDEDSHPTFSYNHAVGEVNGLRSAWIASPFAAAFGVGTDGDDDEAEFPENPGESREAVAGWIAAFV